MRRSLLSVGIGFRTLQVNPLRTVLSTLGVIIGVAALVAVLSLGDGMEAFAREEIRTTTALQVVEVRSLARREVNGVMLPDTAAPFFTVAQAESLAALPGVGGAAMESAAPGLLGHGATEHAAIVRGSLADAAARRGLALAAGRFFSAQEVREGAGVVVLSHPLAAALATGGDATSLVGSVIRMRERAATVVGVLAPRPGGGGRSAPERPLAWVPVSIAPLVQMSVGTPERPSILLEAARVEEVPALHARVQQWIAARPAAWRQRVEARVDDRGAQARRGILLFKLLMGAMTGISLVVGGIGIMNVLLASVAERTREIGIRRAAGARQRDILVQFLSESVAISGLGAAIGLALGFAGAITVTAVMRRMTEAPVHAGFSLSTFVVTASAALGVGLVFGTYPALRAARLAPIDAIHHE